jgi:HEAT repeat protein
MNTTSDHGQPTTPQTRRREAALAGHRDDLVAARVFLTDPDPGVRTAALGALVRLNALTSESVTVLTADSAPAVRRRLAEELGRRWSAIGRPEDAPPPTGNEADRDALVTLLGDPDGLVAEAAAWALGELASSEFEPLSAAERRTVVALLGTAVTDHDDPLVREAAAAALGAVGDPNGLPAVLAATKDKPAVRRRAVIALAAFLGEAGVDEALQRATEDRDWQVRQAASVLLDPHR